jgi:integrase
MPYSPGHLPAHKGTRTATAPIRDYSKVQEVKGLLRGSRRNLALFTLGCNTAFRASDLLSLRRTDLTLLADGRYEVLKVEQKTGKVRRITLNTPTSQVLREHLETSSGDLVFQGQRGRMSVSYLGRLMKSWCREAGIDGRVATHTMRKTFVRLQYEHFGTPLAVLMRALNHSSEQQTLTYVGMLPKDIERLYDNAI